MLMVTELVRVMTYCGVIPYIHSCDTSIWWICEVT